MSDIDFGMLVGVSVPGITFLCEGFPLVEEKGFSYAVDKKGDDACVHGVVWGGG